MAAAKLSLVCQVISLHKKVQVDESSEKRTAELNNSQVESRVLRQFLWKDRIVSLRVNGFLLAMITLLIFLRIA